MRNVDAVETGSGTVVRDQLVSELEHELVSEAREPGGELTLGDAFLATPANAFLATSVNAGSGRPAA